MGLFSKSDQSLLQKRGYTLGQVLGQGSYATVNKATRKKNDSEEHIAIKIIALDQVQEEFKKKFLRRELSISKVLDHPNIIKTIEVIQAKNKVYIPIELATKGDLLEFIQLRGPLPENVAAGLFGDMCRGIEYIHNKQVVHRDLKCENVLLSGKNTAKIADFGFARKQRDNDLSETYCGSAAYAAPELLSGIPYRGDLADVWSLGVILFTMACAMMPFRDGNIKTLMMDQSRPLQYSARFQKSLSTSMKDLMQNMLTHDKDARFSLSDAMEHGWNAEALGGGDRKKSVQEVGEA
ncbi:testis-specific serine/threonine-protein kinase 3-like [Styela clava]